MSTQLAAKLQPYLNYLLIAQLVLLGTVAIIGLLIVIRRVRGRGAPGSLTMDADTIAMEITQEIGRLYDLRKRLSSKFTDSVLPSEPQTKSASAGTGPAVNVGAGASPADLKLVEQQIEARYLDTIADLKSQITKLEEQTTQLKAVAAIGAPNDAVPIENEAAVRDAKAAVEKADKEKGEIQDKLLHLEKVLSEYRLFEEDFALVKRYKAENERLKKQLTESHQVTEDDINNLFSAIDDKPDATGSAAPQVSADDFFSNEFAAAQPAPATEAPVVEPIVEPVVEPVAAQTPEPVFPTAEAILAEPVVAATDAVEPAPTPMTEPEPAPTTSLDDELKALLGESSNEPSTEPALTAAPTQEAVATKEYDSERVKDEPLFSAALQNNLQNSDDLEALAEAAGGDDKLLEEFQKILGEKS